MVAKVIKADFASIILTVIETSFLCDRLKRYSDSALLQIKSVFRDAVELLQSSFFEDAKDEAFDSNNKIEQLCNGTTKPIYLNKFPGVVEDKMKPLLVDFYEDLLEKAKVPGTKKDYYEKLVEKK